MNSSTQNAASFRSTNRWVRKPTNPEDRYRSAWPLIFSKRLRGSKVSGGVMGTKPSGSGKSCAGACPAASEGAGPGVCKAMTAGLKSNWRWNTPAPTTTRISRIISPRRVSMVLGVCFEDNVNLSSADLMDGVAVGRWLTDAKGQWKRLYQPAGIVDNIFCRTQYHPFSAARPGDGR